jgi:C_GCAxxG_C_C family probable redox protein
MSKLTDSASRTFADGFNCCQAVLSAVGEPLGLPRQAALKIAQGMGGGMGHLGLTCGAVTGAFMAIGLVHARLEKDQDAAKQRAYELVAEFARRFKAKNEYLDCRSLLGFSFDDAEAYEVRDAVEILEQLLPLDEHGEKP